MANKIQVKRGLKANIPALNVGEPGFTTDTKEFFIGSVSGNVQLAKQVDLSAHMADMANRGLGAASRNIDNIDLNVLTETGFYYGTNLGHAPYSSYCRVQVISIGGSDYCKQILSLLDDNVVNWERVYRYGAWESWRSHVSELITQPGGVHGFYVETGIWTPRLIGADVAGNHTYSIQQGKYRLYSNEVHVWAQLKLTIKDSAMSGVIRIRGLPFSSGHGFNAQGYCLTEGLTVGPGNDGYIPSTWDAVVPRRFVSTTVNEISSTEVTNNTGVSLYLVYRT